MKRFFKTLAGKTTLFLMCIISMILFISTLFGAFVYYEGNFYTRIKENIENDILSVMIRNDIYDYVYEAANVKDDASFKEADKGNLIFQIKEKGENDPIVYSESAVSVKKFEHSFDYSAQYDEEGYVREIYSSYEPSQTDNIRDFVAEVSIKKNSGIEDFYSLEAKIFPLVYSLRYGVYGIMAFSLLVLIISFVALMSIAGRRNDSEMLYPGPLHKIPFDILCAAVLLGFVFFVYIVDQGFRIDMVQIILVLIGAILFINAFLGLCMSAAVRIKNKDLIKGSFIYWCFGICLKVLKYVIQILKQIFDWFIEILKSIPLIWKVLAVFSFLSLIELFFLKRRNDFLWLFVKMIEFVILSYICLCMHRLLKAGEAMANGDLSYQVDTGRMILDLKKHGEDLSSIAKGMAIAVEERLKSERMKTELITNVSHDIKTPLTSIINYADLISKENVSRKQIKEYSDVLIRQSNRLKRLLEDLVEASKASSGNLEVNLQPCDASIFIDQCAGEYEEKLKTCDLTLITDKPDQQLMIMADPRRMARIFDNLMNNICKYALPGTRVYLTLEEKDKEAIISFKNTSREQLNMSPDELMQRFTRGDASRNSEGNGLGLSIAKSLAELQNGVLDLQIDGDLFKAVLSFRLL